jgi:putative addiction module component (TIGR02574 family)
MSQLTVEQLTHDALTLSENERTRLAHALLRSLETSTETGVDAAWDEEVSRRVEAVRHGTAQGRPADDVFRDVRNRYGK